MASVFLSDAKGEGAMRTRWFPLVSLETQRSLRRWGADVGRLILEEAPPPAPPPPRSGVGHLGPRIAGAVRGFADDRRRAERERDEALARVGELERELEDARDRMREVQQENEDVREQLRVVAASAPGAPSPAADSGRESFQSVAEAVEHASRLDRLRFLPSALQSADESPFERPDDIYRSFFHLSQLAGQRFTGGIGMSVEDWLSARGVDYARRLGREKDMFRFREKYLFDVDGDRVLFEEHVKFGVGKDPHHCLRIYMKWDEERAEWIVGHVGQHLRNAKA